MELQTLERILKSLERSNEALAFSNTILGVLMIISIILGTFTAVISIRALWLTREIRNKTITD